MFNEANNKNGNKEYKWTISKKRGTTNILWVQYTTRAFLTWRVQARASAIASLSPPGLKDVILLTHLSKQRSYVASLTFDLGLKQQLKDQKHEWLIKHRHMAVEKKLGKAHAKTL